MTPACVPPACLNTWAALCLILAGAAPDPGLHRCLSWGSVAGPAVTDLISIDTSEGGTRKVEGSEDMRHGRCHG
jgi:hypothetical protein